MGNITGSWKLENNAPTFGAFWLRELSTVEVTGNDAASFLHGQFTNNINNIADSFRLAAYCQPQGRILALMRVAKRENAFYLVLPTDLVTGFVKRLSMFVLRSDVKIRVADELAVCGLIDYQETLPAVDRVLINEKVIVGRVADWEGKNRALVIGPTDELRSHFNPVDQSAPWFMSEILTGTPWIFEKTKEAFIPQWINLEMIGGLVFDKGCYPGQEIISRVQHIGSTPRRMVLAQSDKVLSLTAGENIFQSANPVGNVVMSVQCSDKTLALFAVSLTSLAAQTFQIQNSEFVLGTLPYSLQE